MVSPRKAFGNLVCALASTVIRQESVVLEEEDPWLSGAETYPPDQNMLVSALHRVVSNYREAKSRARAARRRVLMHFSPYAVARQFETHIQRIRHVLHPSAAGGAVSTSATLGMNPYNYTAPSSPELTPMNEVTEHGNVVPRVRYRGLDVVEGNRYVDNIEDDYLTCTNDTTDRYAYPHAFERHMNTSRDIRRARRRRSNDTPCRIAFISTFPPRECGIAVFTERLMSGFSEICGPEDGTVVSLSVIASVHEWENTSNYDRSTVKFFIHQNDQQSYIEAAKYIEGHDYDLVILQHEFGIFSRSNILCFAGGLRNTPLITVLHTVSHDLGRMDENHLIAKDLERLSLAIVVMTEEMRYILEASHGVSASRIAVLPHGVPDVPFVRTQV